MASVDMHDIDLKEFNEVLAACKGDVFMVTPEGDRLNLKSRLCQLIGFTKLIEGGSMARPHPRALFCVRTRGCARFLQLHRLFARSWTVWFDTVFYKVVL